MLKRVRSHILLLILLLAMAASVFYIIGRIVLWMQAPIADWQKALAAVLLLAEAFIVTHAVGYFLNIFHVLKNQALLEVDPSQQELTSAPVVAIVVPSYHEPIEILASTLTCLRNLTYVNKQLFLLDDSRYDRKDIGAEALAAYRAAVDELCQEAGVNIFRHHWHGAKAGVVNDFLRWNRGEPVQGVSVRMFQDPMLAGRASYIMIFDAEQNPLPDSLEPLVAIAEREPALAFIQTPQYYTNFQSNRVARAAGLMQVFFYEYISEGKGTQNTMFCCGSNVLFREEALWRVGGLDETSVTEDFATSIKLHLAGWSSLYYPRIVAFAQGPVDLGGFFTQQFRWARGTTGLLPTIVFEFLKNPFRLPIVKWWEYFLSATHYLVGLVFLTTAVCPGLYIFLDQPTYFSTADFYLCFYLPYTVMTALAFILSLRLRKYRLVDIFAGILLIPITFPVYISAVCAAVVGHRTSFGVTSKGPSRSLPLIALWPQLLLWLFCGGGFFWGVHRVFYEEQPFWALFANSLWCGYFFVILSSVFYFNWPEE
jgi:cellulose synthase (UDP-forming)